MLLHSSLSVQIEQNAVKFKFAPRKHESIANNQMPPKNLVSMPLSHSHRLSILPLCLWSLRNKTPSKVKLHRDLVLKYT